MSSSKDKKAKLLPVFSEAAGSGKSSQSTVHPPQQISLTTVVCRF